MQKSTKISERRACQLVGLSRTVLHYEPKSQPSNEHLQARLIELAGERRRFGYRRIGDLLRAAGTKINDKRVYRLYKLADLSVRSKRGLKAVLAPSGQMSTTCLSNEKPTRQVVPSPGSMLAVRWLMRTITPTRVLRYLSSKATFSPQRKSLRVGRGVAYPSG